MAILEFLLIKSNIKLKITFNFIFNFFILFSKNLIRKNLKKIEIY